MARPADPFARDALIAAARAEFAKKGLRGARIEDITAACQRSKGAFYLHFPSKEALFGSLVEAFQGELAICSAHRCSQVEAFVREGGPLTGRDVEERSPRYRSMLALEAAEDLAALESMWKYRDVLGVLIRGTQGTQFEGAVWQIIDAEVKRIADTFHEFQHAGTCRRDVPAELLGSLIVGTYLLVGERMSRLSEKPDLAEWAATLQRLIREGSAPRAEVSADPARTVQSPSRRAPRGHPSRRSSHRSTP